MDVSVDFPCEPRPLGCGGEEGDWEGGEVGGRRVAVGPLINAQPPKHNFGIIMTKSSNFFYNTKDFCMTSTMEYT